MNGVKYLVQTGENRRFMISKSLYLILSSIDGEKNINEISEKCSQVLNRSFTPSEINSIISKLLIPYGLVESNYQRRTKQNKSFYDRYLRLRLSLFSQSTIKPITSVLSNLFNPRVFYPSVLLMILFHLYFYFLHEKNPIAPGELTIVSSILIYCIILISAFCHEIGHASACHYFGAEHGDIGFGLYLVFPVFFTDVSDIWKIKRSERVIVDSGGIFFQGFFIIMIFILYSLYNHILFIYAIYILDYTILISLNPLLRYDGYWIVSDALGIPNLRKYAQGILTNRLRKLLSGNEHFNICKQDLKPYTKTMLILYVILSNIYFIYFTFKLISFIFQAIKSVV